MMLKLALVAGIVVWLVGMSVSPVLAEGDKMWFLLERGGKIHKIEVAPVEMKDGQAMIDAEDIQTVFERECNGFENDYCTEPDEPIALREWRAH